MSSNFYSICSTQHPLAIHQTEIRRAEYNMWQSIYASVQTQADVRDWTEHAASLRAHIGGSDHANANNLLALETLEYLPNFSALVESMMHVSIHVLRRIGLTLCCDTFWGDTDNQASIDQFLVEFLTPTRPNQAMPGTTKICNKLTEFLRLLAVEEGTEPEDPYARYSNVENSDGTFTVSSTWDPVTAGRVDALIRKHAANNDLTLAEAHAELLLGKADIKIVMNLYRASDIVDSPVWMPGVGFLGQSGSALADELTTYSRDILAAATEQTTAYRVTSRIRAYLEGRDGTCRWPGCSRPAHRTEKDHRVNWDEGGPTTPWNMVCLCAHHHNRKTDGVINYILDPITGDVYWLFSDGTWSVDEASGPLAPKNARWISTLNHRKQRRRMRKGPLRPPKDPRRYASIGDPNAPPF
ncbi:HNH endonuclease signature motif containing protein [Corynebacterium breve]|uniref:HNH endonuclease signature motif containing protein n=1 Tax=Corynebacterium breve TaxID=3049799 RepID=A0ABY8VFS6_9CORY|nr:HNH endonuclease signature motif containing protein [Corynebacterium breve]WIM68187.1 HNH endonuclease signature motif containing protein [Corynebacterium breve]